jgi:hypothetical protein
MKQVPLHTNSDATVMRNFLAAAFACSSIPTIPQLHQAWLADNPEMAL